MPERIIDMFEIINIKQDHAKRLPAVDLFVQALHKHPAVLQTCQCIKTGCILHALFCTAECLIDLSPLDVIPCYDPDDHTEQKNDHDCNIDHLSVPFIKCLSVIQENTSFRHLGILNPEPPHNILVKFKLTR